MDTTQPTTDPRQYYRKRMDKRLVGKPFQTKVLMERTFCTAVWCLELISELPFSEIASGVYFYCKDVVFRDIVRQYDAQIELAGAAPDKFVFGLHAFYNSIATQVKKNGTYREFAEFMGEAMRLRATQAGSIDTNLINAYTNLILQTLEYIRPDKMDLETCLLGVSTDGQPLYGPQPFPYVDLPSIKVQELCAKGLLRTEEARMQALIQFYQDYATSISSFWDAKQFEATQRAQANTYTAMLPFINEYTFDILPETQYDASGKVLRTLHVSADLSDLKAALRHRKRTLPNNGVRVSIEDPTKELRGVLLKEIFHNGAVHLLYRIMTDDGDLCGYYDTASGYLFSITAEINIPSIYLETSAFILFLYASQVLDGRSLPETDGLVTQSGLPICMQAFGMGGKLRAVGQEATRGSIRARDADGYTHKEQPINGFIRAMPEGWEASEEARQAAEELGYDLAPNETYVRPFMRQTFIKRPDEPQPAI